MLKNLIFISLFLLLLNSVCADKLLHLDVLFRHGDRAPIGVYKTDPYQETFWPVPFGELMTAGMQQAFDQGRKMRDRYANFLPSNYSVKDIHVQSTDVNRTLMTASSFLAALYADSNGTRPAGDLWPRKWNPIPIHTVELATDHLLNPGALCVRMQELEVERATNGEFLAFMAEHLPLFEEISQHTGETILHPAGLIEFFDCIDVERRNNLTLPAWLTETKFQQIRNVTKMTEDFMFGGAGFGKPQDNEMVMLKGGMLLQQILGNMESAVTNGGTGKRIHVYSAHDTTVLALLRCLEAKTAVLGFHEPDFAATIVMEIWSGDGKPYVKVWYSDNSSVPFRDVTSGVGGCGGADRCSLATFKQRSQQFLPGDIEKKCDKL